MSENECTKCIHKEVCKTAESCDGYVSGCEHFKEQKQVRMDVREKLVELFAVTSLEFEDAVTLADHLIANGVEIPVRCKDCKHYKTRSQSAKWKPKAPCCTRAANIFTKPDDFCSCGERRDNDG